MGDQFQDPQGTPEAVDSTEPYVCFSYIHTRPFSRTGSTSRLLSGVSNCQHHYSCFGAIVKENQGDLYTSDTVTVDLIIETAAK